LENLVILPKLETGNCKFETNKQCYISVNNYVLFLAVF
jgi:hypothetical protein